MLRQFYVYILFNHARTLYTGVTNDIVRRVDEHREGKVPGFTAKYKVHHLGWYELHGDVNVAIAREKQIKGWTRAKKVALIETMNPRWEDLGDTLRERFSAESAPPPIVPAAAGEGIDLDAPGKILRR